MKKELKPATILHPHPVLVVGSYDQQDKPNMMTASWGGICCSKPPAIMIALREATQTYHNIKKHNCFTVNIPSTKHIKEADYVGIASGKDTDKYRETGLTPVESNLIHAPYVKEYPYCLECTLIKEIEIGLHTMFIGEIMGIKADENVLGVHGTPDIELVDPLIYGSFGNRGYYTIGKRIGDAFKIGGKK